MGKSAKQLLEEANSSLNVISVEEARSLMSDENVIFVDVKFSGAKWNISIKIDSFFRKSALSP